MSRRSSVDRWPVPLQSCPELPAMLPGVVAVSAIGSKGAKSWFSNYGSYVKVRWTCTWFVENGPGRWLSKSVGSAICDAELGTCNQ